MHGAQSGDCGEKAERAAMRRDKQRRIGRCDLTDVVARNVGDHKDARLLRIVERRRDARRGRARRKVAQTGASFGATPGLRGIGGAIGQGRRGDE